MSDCIFCKIIEGDIASETVHKTDSLVVIKDVNPQAPTHLLIIPKKHYASILDCSDWGLLGEMLLTASEVARKIGVDERGFRTVINTNEEGGQTVAHLHMHLLAGRPLAGGMG